MPMFQHDELVCIVYIDSNFQSYKDSLWFTSIFVFSLSGVTTSWRSVKQSYITESTMKVEYIVAFEAVKEVV